MKRVAIVCNGLAPQNGLPIPAQGVRALGFFHGLRAHGVPVDIVATARSVLPSIKRFGPASFKSDPSVRILSDDNFERALNSEYSNIIVSNWPALAGFRKTGNVQLVYDFFSPTLVEHSFFDGPAAIERKSSQKLALIKQADAAIANSDRIARYGRDFLNKHKVTSLDPTIVRLSQKWGGPCSSTSSKIKIFLGGYKQFWSQRNDYLLGSVLKNIGEIDAVIVGGNINYFKNIIELDEKIDDFSDNLHLKPSCDFYNFNKFNNECDLSIDFFSKNEERLLSYSSRCISSISNGCPVMTMSFTEIGKMVEETSAGWSIGTVSEDEITGQLVSIKSDSRQLKAAQDATRDFWELYCNPKDQAIKLLEVLNV